jgi:hypothetical protein
MVGSMSSPLWFCGSLLITWTVVLIGIGFLYLDKDGIPDPVRLPGERPWTTHVGFFHTRGRRACLSAVYILFNLYISIVTFLPPYQNPGGSERAIKGWVYPAVVGATIAAGFLYYWAAFRGNEKSVFRLAKARGQVHSEDSHDAIYGCRRYVIVAPDDPVSHIQATKSLFFTYWQTFFFYYRVGRVSCTDFLVDKRKIESCNIEATWRN